MSGISSKKSALMILLVLICSFCFADPDLSGIDIQGSITKVNSGFNSFAKEVRNTMPNTMTGQNVYADSYIGDFLPAGKHFAAGLNFSVTHLNSSELSSTFETMSSLFKVIGHDISMSVPSDLVLPSVTLDGRIGGFYIPLDFGFTFTAISPDSFKINPEKPDTFVDVDSPIKISRGDFDGKITLFSIGFDARYTVLKDRKYAPDVSVGAGYYFSKGALKMETTDVNQNGTLEVHMAHSFQTQVISLQAQASKKLSIFTPFAGTKLLWSASENGWVRKVYLDGVYMPMSGTNCLKRGFEDFYIEPQLFAGTGITAGPVQFTFSADFDLRNVNAGGSFSVRYKR